MVIRFQSVVSQWMIEYQKLCLMTLAFRDSIQASTLFSNFKLRKSKQNWKLWPYIISCHERVSEWMYTLWPLECQGSPCLNRHHIWSLTKSNGIQTHKHIVRKRTLNHLTKATKPLTPVVSTYLCGAFEYMLLSCHVRVSESSSTLKLPELSRNSLLETDAIIEVYVTATGFEHTTMKFVNEHSTI